MTKLHKNRIQPLGTVAPSCACGCSSPVKWGEGKFNRYVTGHNDKARTSPDFLHYLGGRLKYQVDPITGCWLWIAGVNNKGYGTTNFRGRIMYAHRASWEMANGTIPDGKVLDHLCRTPRCVRPEHLEIVTQAENCRRGARTKLDSVKVAEIVGLWKSGNTQASIARIYGVDSSQISRICRGIKWVGVCGGCKEEAA